MRDSFQKECLVKLLGDYAEHGDTDVYGSVSDLLTDIKHYCDKHNIDFDAAVERAKTVAAEEAKPKHFTVETVEHRVYRTTYVVEAKDSEEAKNLVAEGEGQEQRDELDHTDTREITNVKPNNTPW